MADKNIESKQAIGSEDELEEVTMESTTSELIKTDILQQSSMAPETPKEQTVKTKKKGRAKLDILLIIGLIALAVSGIAGLFAYLELDSIATANKAKQQEKVESNIQSLHNIMFGRVNKYRKLFKSISDEISEDPQSAFQNSQLVQEKADKFFPEAKLSYLAIPIDSAAIIADESLGYVYLDILNSLSDAKNQQEISKLEVLKPRSKDAQAILVSILKNKDNQTTGFITIQTSKKLLSKMFQNLNTSGGDIVVKQGSAGSIRLYSTGTTPADKVTAKKSLRDTNWQIEHNLGYDKFAFSFEHFWLFLIFALLGLIFLIIGIALITASIKKQLAIKRKKQLSQQKEKSTADSLQELASVSATNTTAIKEHDSFVNGESNKDVSIIEPGKIPDSIFLDYDIRGIIDYNLNAEVFRLLGKAIANEMDDLERTDIIVGYDGRNSSVEYANALIEGMVKNGLKVFNIGMVPTPLLYYSAMEKTHGNGVMVTASHNPKDHNGLKILMDGEIYHQDKLKSLQNKTEDNELADPGSSEALDMRQEYIEKLSYLVSNKKKFKVAVDCGNGVAGLIITELLEKMGCEIIPLYTEVDGNFPNHHPDPTRTENLQDLIDAVVKNKADLGMAFDGDGDRLGIISSAGEIIWMDRLLMLLAKDILSRNPQAKVLYDVKSSSALHEWIIQCGGEPEMCPSGHSNVKERMAVSGAILAAELSGHVFIKENWYAFDDPYYAAIKVLELLSNDGRSSQKLFAELPDKINTPEILIPVQPGQADEIMQKILAEKNEFEGAGIVLIDGLRAEYEDGWGLVRTSKTSSKLTLRFEADTPEALQRIAEKFKEVVLSVVFVKFPY